MVKVNVPPFNPSDVIAEQIVNGKGQEDEVGAALLNVVKAGDMEMLKQTLNCVSPKETLLILMNWLHKWQQEYQCVMESLLQYIDNNGEDNGDVEEHNEEIEQMDLEAKEILGGFETLTLALLTQCNDTSVVNIMDDMGWTLLMQAANFGSISFVQSLLDRRANISIRQHNKDDGMHALARAVDVGHLNVVEMLTAKDTINAAFEYTNEDDTESEVEFHTPLSLACRHGHEDIVHFLLSQSILDINQHLPHSGDTALHIATCFEHHDLVEQLIQNKNLNINATNAQGYTAVFGCSNAELVSLLLSSGLDASITGNEGETAFDLAVALEDEEVAQVLETHMTSSS